MGGELRLWGGGGLERVVWLGRGVPRACLEEAGGGEGRDAEKHDLGLEGGSGGKKKISVSDLDVKLEETAKPLSPF